MILVKLGCVFFECSGKGKFALSMEKMSMSASKRFACTAIHPERWNLRGRCVRASRPKESRFALRNFPNEREDRQSKTNPRPWAGGRNDDRDGVDDRVGHFHYLGGILAIKRRAGMVAARVGRRWFVDDYRRTLLLGARDHDAARRRRLCFFTRSIRTVHRVFVRLDFVSGDS